MPTSSSVFAGFGLSYACPLRDSTHSPMMKFLNIRGATDVAILPPQSPKLAALLFVWSPADLNARHYRAESKFYRRSQERSNLPADTVYSWAKGQSGAAHDDDCSQTGTRHRRDFPRIDGLVACPGLFW